MRNDSDCCRTWITELLAVLGDFNWRTHWIVSVPVSSQRWNCSDPMVCAALTESE
jgi:hypothetical protein